MRNSEKTGDDETSQRVPAGSSSSDAKKTPLQFLFVKYTNGRDGCFPKSKLKHTAY